MGADGKLRMKVGVIFQFRMGSEDLVGLSDEYLLNLNVKMCFGLFNENQMQWWNETFSIRAGPCLRSLSNPHPRIAEAHQAKHHRYQVLIPQAVVFFGEC